MASVSISCPSCSATDGVVRKANAVYGVFYWLILFLSCESPLTESLLT
ncbi:hypothetical protein FHB04_13890 [Escherichia coli]|nr:hypothetical protein [Escherichia coli]